MYKNQDQDLQPGQNTMSSTSNLPFKRSSLSTHFSQTSPSDQPHTLTAWPLIQPLGSRMEDNSETDKGAGTRAGIFRKNSRIFLSEGDNY